MNKLTYQDLLEKLYEMSPENRMCHVQLRDYSNQETFKAVDFVPLNADSNIQTWQIGFND